MKTRGSTTYLNAASHGLPHASVYKRVMEHLKLEMNAGPVRALHEVQNELRGVRKNAAQLITSEAEDVAFSTTGSAAWATLVSSLEFSSQRVLVAPHEWGTNLVTLKLLAKAHGFSIEVLPHLNAERLDLSDWEKRMDDDVCALFVPMMTSISGQRYPVEAIGSLPRPRHCHYIVDAAQALGQMPVNVGAIKCDGLVAPTRKWLRGPRQTAIIWKSPDAPGQAGLLPEHAAVKYERLVDYNVAVRLGLGVAIERALDDSVEHMQSVIMSLANEIQQHANELSLALVSVEDAQSGIVSFCIPNANTEAVRSSLLKANCEVKWPDVSVEPQANIAVENTSILRLSPHVYNTSDNIDVVFDAIKAGLR
ncbi:MAG: aminotransferase class V-fold PLP-dependent enzyme [Granulosicoccus sp.]